MDLGLAGKRAIVLSSSRDLGCGIAEALAAEGAHVLMTARSGDRLKEAADAIGTASVLFYLVVYGFTTVGAFAVVTLVRDSAGEATHLAKWAGLGKRSPVVAATFALFLLA